MESDHSVLVRRWTFPKRFLSFPPFFPFETCIFLSFVEALQPDAGFHRQAGHRVEATAGWSLRTEAEGFSHTGSLTATARASWCSISPRFSPLFCFPLKWIQIFFSGWGSEISMISRNSRLESFSKFQIWHEEAILNITMVFCLLKKTCFPFVSCSLTQ